MAAAADRTRFTAMGALLVLLCFVVYAPALSNGFVWDDELVLSRNPAVAAGLSGQSLRWAWTTFHTGNWYPLTWFSHLLDVSLFGLEPPGHHLVNLLFHCANSLLTFLVFRKMTGAFWGSALVAALFAVHPLHVESVAWAAERKDVLSTFLWLLALQAWIGWLRRPRRSGYVAVIVLYALALLAKAMPVTFPFLLLLLDWWPFGRFAPGRRTALAAEKAPLLVLAVLAGAVTYVAQSSVAAVGLVPLPVRLANAAQSYWRYLFKAVWPADLALLYPFPMAAPALVATVLAVAALAVVTVLVLRARWHAPALLVGWFWFLGTLVPVIGFVQVGIQSMADRYTYVPLTGVFLMAIWGLGGLAGRPRRRGPWLAAATVIGLAALTITARAQVGTWRDPVAAFTNALKVTQDNLAAHTLLSGYYYERGDDRMAEEQARAALAISGEDAGAHGRLALVLERGGRTAEAIAEYRKALAGDSRRVELYNNLGALLAAAGDPGGAENTLLQALRLRSDFPLAHSNLGKLLARQGRIAAALPHFREAVRLSPGTAIYHGDLGAALAALGRLEEARPALEQALRLDPSLAVVRENLARALAQRAHGPTGECGPSPGARFPAGQAPGR